MGNLDTGFDLGPLLDHQPRPRFQAIAGGLAYIVELDSSAVMKLSGKDVGADVASVIAGRTAQIRAAAQRLHDQGFVANDQDGPLIVVSAIDLD